MRKILTAMLVILCAQLLAAEDSFVETFGWGKALISEKNSVGSKGFDAKIFDYSDGVFKINGGKKAQMNMRFLNRNGIKYAAALDALKQSNAQAVKTWKKDIICTFIWVSHDVDGRRIETTPPLNDLERPQWNYYDAIYSVYDDNIGQENTSVLLWEKLLRDRAPFTRWLVEAKSGYRVYIRNTVGFTRDKTESKTYDERSSSWKIPTEDIFAAPLSGSTIIVR